MNKNNWFIFGLVVFIIVGGIFAYFLIKTSFNFQKNAIDVKKTVTNTSYLPIKDRVGLTLPEGFIFMETLYSFNNDTGEERMEWHKPSPLDPLSNALHTPAYQADRIRLTVFSKQNELHDPFLLAEKQNKAVSTFEIISTSTEKTLDGMSYTFLFLDEPLDGPLVPYSKAYIQREGLHFYLNFGPNMLDGYYISNWVETSKEIFNSFSIQ